MATPQRWKKLGRIISPEKVNREWMVTHAMDPTVDPLAGGLTRIYFSGRNRNNQSLIGYTDIDVGDPERILRAPDRPVLGLGELGCFDDNGVTPSCLVNHQGMKYLYYIGWKPRSTTRLGLMTGLAVSEDGESFRRVSRAPILHLTDAEPFSILTAPYVLVDNGIWRMWYVSCTAWVHADLPRYNIKYAESKDGLHWRQEGQVAIDYQSEDELALARPCVRKEEGRYRMWYCFKRGEQGYRMGYAESSDGMRWQRMDELVGLHPSQQGWDSEMVEYPQLFEQAGQTYMVYNGNGYGTNGAGLALLERP